MSQREGFSLRAWGVGSWIQTCEVIILVRSRRRRRGIQVKRLIDRQTRHKRYTQVFPCCTFTRPAPVFLVVFLLLVGPVVPLQAADGSPLPVWTPARAPNTEGPLSFGSARPPAGLAAAATLCSAPAPVPVPAPLAAPCASPGPQNVPTPDGIRFLTPGVAPAPCANLAPDTGAPALTRPALAAASFWGCPGSCH